MCDVMLLREKEEKDAVLELSHASYYHCLRLRTAETCDTVHYRTWRNSCITYCKKGFNVIEPWTLKLSALVEYSSEEFRLEFAHARPLQHCVVQYHHTQYSSLHDDRSVSKISGIFRFR